MLRDGLRAACVLLACGAMGAGEPPRFAPDHVVVKFRQAPASPLPGKAVLRELGFARWRRGEVRAGRQTDFPIHAHALSCSVPTGWSVTQLVATLRQRTDVEYAEPDYIGTGGAVYPDDPQFTNQWHLFNWQPSTNPVPADIRMPDAWSLTTGSTNIILAILDTGLNTGLVEFAGRVLPGYDFVNGDTDPTDDHEYGHGSTVASVAAAAMNDGLNGAGGNPQCRIMPVKVLNSFLFGLYSDWAAGIEWAVSNGAHVINLSAGGFDDGTLLSNAIMNAISAGVLFVTITHNDASSSIRFPGRMLPCLTVGATQSNDTRTTVSNSGPEVDVVAPGHNIVTSDHRGTNVTVSGTSFAAPQVAAVAALLRGLRPELTPDDLRVLLCASADDQVGDPLQDTAGFDVHHGWGRLNAYAALQLALTRVSAGEPVSNEVRIAWSAPSNASNRTPFRVAHAPAPDGPWTDASPAFTYTPTGAAAQVSTATSAILRVTIGLP